MGQIQGTAGHDSLSGTDSDDTLTGGTGNDTLSGGEGSDVYVFNRGDGQDVLWDDGIEGQLDTLSFGTTIAPSQITVSPSSDGCDLVVRLSGTTDQITLSGVLLDPRVRIEQVRFSDGTQWSWADLLARATTPTSGADLFYGDESANALSGLAGDDTLSGSDGDDTLTGGAGNDLLVGGSGRDTVVFNRGDGQDVLWDDGSEGEIDTLSFGATVLPDQISVGQGDDGSDIVLRLSGTTDQVTLSQVLSDPRVRIEQVLFANGTRWSWADLFARATAPTAGADVLYGDELANALGGAAGADSLNGRDGDDTLGGGTGNDTLVGGSGADTYIFNVGDGQDLVWDGGDDDQTDTLAFGTGILSSQISASRSSDGNDIVLRVGSGTDLVTLGNVLIDTRVRVEQVRFADGTLWNWDTLVSRLTSSTTLQGTEGTDALTGGSAAELLLGLGGNDTLTGNGGNDTLDGGQGNDTLIGGADDDTFVFATGDGQDTLRSESDSRANRLETLQFAAGIAPAGVTVKLNGTALEFTFAGSTDKVTVESFWVGGTASHAANPLQRVVFAGTGEVWDLATLVQKATASIGPTDGADTLTGTVQNDSINGLGGNDLISGLAGNDTLDGGTGADTLQGGSGDDLYIVDHSGDVVTELAGDGRDEVRSSLSWTLASDLETLVLTGTGANSATGNDAANLLTGNAAANTLDGGGGADTLAGGQGNDTLVGGADDDTFVFAAGDGQDTLRSESDSRANRLETLQFAAGIAPASVSVKLNGAALEFTFAGSTDKVTVESFWVGGTASHAANPLQRVVFAGTGEVWDLAKLTALVSGGGTGGAIVGTEGNDGLTGTASAELLRGLGGVDTLNGLAGDDTLDGGKGKDVLIGGLGNDTYIVDTAGETVTEKAGEGIDTVQASVSWTLGAELEHLTLLGSAALNATGNAAANVLTGNAGANVLAGLKGADTMIGGQGDDTYVVDHAGDVITELAGEGTDTVATTLKDYALGDHVENLRLTGVLAGVAWRSATGNALANVLTGSGQADLLDGLAGADTMIGSRGNDLYRVDHAGDVVTELAGEGSDTVQTAVSYTLGATLENLQLLDGAAVGVGNALDNLLYGRDGADRLEGLAGNDTLFDADEAADTLLGGAGNDVYVVDTGDVITENASEGTDEVQVAADYTLGANLENLRLGQIDGLAAAFAGTGNALANTLWGTDDDNVLDGGAGKDRLLGGKGHDVYVVDDSGDTVVENAGEGLDTVKTALAAWTLGANVENLTLLDGTAASQGTGNALDNVLLGNAGANTFNGSGGNDTLVGGRGADILTGGTGNDLFCFGAADQATDTVKDFASKADRLVFLGADFGGLAAGAPGAGQFVSAKGNHNATQTGPQFIYDASTGGLWFDADGTGAQAAWQVATLSNKAAIVATDLQIVDAFF